VEAATSAGLSASPAVQRRREIDKDLLPAFNGRGIPSITRLELHQYQDERRAMLQAWADFLEGNKPSSHSSASA
jgi:hypothetical protein